MTVLCSRVVLRTTVPRRICLAKSLHVQWSLVRAQCRFQHSSQNESISVDFRPSLVDTSETQHSFDFPNALQRDSLVKPDYPQGQVQGAAREPFYDLARSMLHTWKTVKFRDRDGLINYPFDPVFLRDSCQCVQCRDPDSGQKKFATVDIPMNISPHSVKTDEWGNMSIRWHNDLDGYSEDHQTIIRREFLRRRIDPTWRTAPNTFTPWVADQLANFHFKPIEYNAFMTDSKATSTALRLLQSHGLVVIRDVPESETAVETIGERIGPLRNTFYGRTWDVKDKPRAENVAYTSQHLELHMDLLYMKNPPGLQLLHCIHASKQGGTSIFADSYKAAEIIEAVSSVDFHHLATFPVAYAYNKGGNWYEDQKPVFELGPNVHPSSKLSLTDRLRAINWSPPFQGNLRYNPGVGTEARELRAWHRAAKAFQALISSPELTFEHKMQPGECVIFNNRRVLHGRTAFESNVADGPDAADAKPRWLKGAYVDTDVFESACSRFYHEARTQYIQRRVQAGQQGAAVDGAPDLQTLLRHEQEASLDGDEGVLFGRGAQSLGVDGKIARAMSDEEAVGSA